MSNKKLRKLSCSFHSESKNKFQLSQLLQIEQSILREYKKLAYSQETVQYSIDPLLYTELPKSFPSYIRKANKYGIILERFTFFEMFTILITQYLYKKGSKKKIHHLKKLIYDNGFLQGNFFTKGLLIKGFKEIESSLKNKNPIGECLLRTDSIVAFSECWRQLVGKICLQNNLPPINDEEIDSSIFQIFSCYFKVNFQVYWKESSTKYSKEKFTFLDCDEIKAKDAPTLSVVVNPSNQISVSQRSIRVTESRISNMSELGRSQKSDNSWNYIVLVNDIEQRELDLDEVQCVTAEKEFPRIESNQQISRISEVEFSCGEAEEIKNLFDNKFLQTTSAKPSQHKPRMTVEKPLHSLLQTIEKANKLIEDVKQYSQFLEGVKG